jgi:uncharacterized membrane protein YdjX (TVP38/TMEM64 family)
MPQLHAGPAKAFSASSAWKGAAALIVFTAALALVASSDTIHDVVVRGLSAVEAVIADHPRWGAVLFVAGSALSAMLAFFSTAVIVPVAVLTWGMPASIALLWLGWLLGGVCAYSIARWLGRPAVAALTSGAALSGFEQRIHTRAPIGLVLLFQVAVPSEIPGYVLGMARYPFLKYLFVLALGELPYAISTVYLGESFLERRTAVLIGIGVVGAVLSGWALHRLQKRLSV